MALINYVEPTSMGDLFVGLGVFVFCLLSAYAAYTLFRKFFDWIGLYYTHDMKHLVLVEHFLDEIAEEKGVDLNKELIEREVLMGVKRNKKMSFRKKVEDQIFERMFGKDEEKKVKE